MAFTPDWSKSLKPLYDLHIFDKTDENRLMSLKKLFQLFCFSFISHVRAAEMKLFVSV